MLYPLSYEGGVHISAGHTLRAVFLRRLACPIPALGVPVRFASNGFLNRVSPRSVTTFRGRPTMLTVGNARQSASSRGAIRAWSESEPPSTLPTRTMDLCPDRVFRF
jgi:hypothetical protein